jgi:hypothetical protein
MHMQYYYMILVSVHIKQANLHNVHVFYVSFTRGKCFSVEFSLQPKQSLIF